MLRAIATVLLLPALTTATNAVGLAFLQANAQQPGVGVLPNGLQVRICQQGTGNVSPDISTEVSVHYEGRTAQTWTMVPKGQPFDSSFVRGQPATFVRARVIRAWESALRLMRAGDVWELYTPSELAYGEIGTRDGVIGPGDALIFRLELLSVNGPGLPYQQQPGAPQGGGCAPRPLVALNGDGGDGSGGGGGYITAILLAFAAGGGGYYYYKKLYSQRLARQGSIKLKEEVAVTPQPQPPPPTSAPPPTLPAGWQPVQDPSTGASYYYNSVTGESTWVLPSTPLHAPSPGPPPPPPPRGPPP